MRVTFMRLKDKIAIVTGGNEGIGRSISLIFTDEGSDIVIARRERVGS